MVGSVKMLCGVLVLRRVATADVTTDKTLAQVDREILFSLLLCCRQAEQELGRQLSEPQKPESR